MHLAGRVRPPDLVEPFDRLSLPPSGHVQLRHLLGVFNGERLPIRGRFKNKYQSAYVVTLARYTTASWTRRFPSCGKTATYCSPTERAERKIARLFQDMPSRSGSRIPTARTAVEAFCTPEALYPACRSNSRREEPASHWRIGGQIDHFLQDISGVRPTAHGPKFVAQEEQVRRRRCLHNDPKGLLKRCVGIFIL